MRRVGCLCNRKQSLPAAWMPTQTIHTEKKTAHCLGANASSTNRKQSCLGKQIQNSNKGEEEFK